MVYAVPAVVGAEYSFVVLTASMTPAIAPGDVVIVDERDPAAIAEGDVITFVRGDSEVPVTHRVVGVTTTGGGVAFETRGDANGAPDAALVPGANVLGVVAVTIPYLGYAIQFADSPVGFALLVVVPFGLLVASELWTVARGRGRGPTEADSGVAVATDAGAASVTPATDSDAASVTPATGSEPVGVSVDAVVGAGAVLAAVAPYSVYVAFQLRTALAISAAIAAVALLLGAVALWVADTGALDRSDPSPVADDGDGDDRGDSSVAADDPVAIADGAGEVD
ncbi:MAG: signal peptidase I [Halobacteriota archaeon]|uniref:signal peptidase I n=1 Tax=Halorubrum sp. TaxID=1879286 RepID=UPI003970EE53